MLKILGIMDLVVLGDKYGVYIVQLIDELQALVKARRKQVVLNASAVSEESVMIVTLCRLFSQGSPVWGSSI